MQFIDLVQWWNLVFDLPFVAGLIPLLLQATGAAHLGHGGHGLHLEGHHGLHLGHHGHIGGTHAGSHGHVDHGHALTQHGHPNAGHGIVSRVLGLLGIGKVPFMMVLSSFCLIWGFTGVMSNYLLEGMISLPQVYVVWSAVFAFVLATVFTSLLSQGFARAIPAVESYGTREEDLVGLTGVAAYEITSAHGAASICDRQSNRIQVYCRVEGSLVVPTGSKVELLQYNEDMRTFIVRPLQATLETTNHLHLKQ